MDYVVQLVGTGGTLAGLSAYLRTKNPDDKVPTLFSQFNAFKYLSTNMYK